MVHAIHQHACRLEQIDDDFSALIKLINKRRPPGTPPLRNKLRSANRGALQEELAQEAAADAKQKIALRHLQKYQDCGPRCFELAQRYFADDFRLLDFPTVSTAV